MILCRTDRWGAPRRVEEVARGAGYRLVYVMQCDPGGALLQRVTTVVRASDALGATVLEYRGAYEEVLRGEARDVHAFHVEEDGWSRAALAALVARATPAGERGPELVARVEMEKRFELGLASGSPGRSGILEGAQARLVVRGPGWEVELPAPAAPARGSGHAAGDGPPRFFAREWFGWGAASAGGRLVSEGYRELEGGIA